jgi:hypothetical protein
MKKKIMIISVALIGFVLAVTSNSWAQRERVGKHQRDRGGHFQKWDNPALHKFDRTRGRGDQPQRQHYRPVHHFKPKFHRRHHYRAPHRYRHKYRLWRHRPDYRQGHHRRPYWRHHRRAVINNHYSSAEGYAAPEEEFHGSASVSDSGFSVSVAVSKTN